MPNDITRRDHIGTFLRATTQTHQFQLKPFQGIVLEVEDEHFHHDSAVLLPNYPPDNRPVDGPSLGLAVLAECLKHQSANPKQSLLLAGHADTSGADQYNLDISLQRSNAVLYALTGDREPWISICLKKHKTEDYQLILKWIADVYGWDCDPGTQSTTSAVKKFQKIYNQGFEKSIAVDGDVGHDTWGAIFDVYMDMVQNLCETDEDGLAQLRDKLNFIGPKAVGCGENWPIDEPSRQNYRSKINRRVEIIFFDPGQEPKLDCHPGKGCTPILCELYNSKMYKFTFLPVPPSSPKDLQVFLKLTYIGPEDTVTEHIFPTDFPVTVVWKDLTPHAAKVTKDGLLRFSIPRSQGPFTLKFDTADVFVSAGPAATAGQEKLGATGDIPTLHQQKHCFFKVPKAWTLKQSDWTPAVAPHYDQANFVFNLPAGLRLGVTLGTTKAPEGLKLDPHWSYVRFEFFDRYFGHTDHSHKRVNTPATMIDGWRISPATGDPDTRSHWTIRDDQVEKAVHSVPWIIQFQEDRTADTKPDKLIQLGFQNAAPAFVISDTATSRKVDAITDLTKLKPSADRLKIYDLPDLWKSQNYFTRFSDGTGEFFDKAATFEGKIQASTTADTPLAFSLDDMILVDGAFNVITLAATENPVVFFHQFKDPGPGVSPKPVSPTGVYNPGADLTKPYFPYSDIVMPVLSYINDYPNWTRLVAAQGNAFDVFDKRTPDGAGRVVGARAAVRWVDASVAAVGQQANGSVAPRPGRTAGTDFFTIQPFFEQLNDQHRGVARANGVYQEWKTPYSGNTWDVGRVDMLLLRDCDVINASKELIINLHYFRFQLDYTSAPAPLNAAGGARNTFRQNVVTNIPTRWNGPDALHPDPSNDPFNPAPPKLKPTDATKLLEGGIRWFVQDLPAGKQHFHINVISINRANMNGFDGSGNYGPTVAVPAASASFDNPTLVLPGWFTAAHECGHGDSLLDEYNEKYGLASYFDRSFATWIDGDPYEDDATAMMLRNQDVRPRHYWHAVEWSRAVSGIDFDLDIGGAIYKLPHHPSNTAPDLRTFVTWPYWAEVGITAPAGRRHFDMYLYAIGNEPYARIPVVGQDLRGLLMVETKILVIFDDPNVTFSNIRDTLRDLTKAITTTFCNQFVVTGAVVDSSGGVDLSPCLVQFRPRYLVQTFPTNFAPAGEAAALSQYFNLLGVTAGTPPQPANVPATEPGRTQFLTNTAPGLHAGVVSGVKSGHPEFFQVNVKPSYTTAWDSAGIFSTIFGSGVTNTMKLKDSALRGPEFVPLFGEMFGLDTASGMPTTAVLKTRIQDRIVRRAMSGGTIA